MATSSRLTKPQINQWYKAVLGIFFASGLVTASLLARLPDVATGLGLSAGPMGMLLLGQTIGSFTAVSLSGVLVTKFGARKCLTTAYTLTCLSILAIGIAVNSGSTLMTLLALITMGLGTAVSNIAANVQGVAAERSLGRFVTPIMHGFFSIGTVIGAGIGALTTKLGVSFMWHMAGFSLVIYALVLFCVTRCFSENTGQDDTQALAQVSSYRVRDAWRDKHTILIGFFVLGMALAEGAANDWVALALTHDYGTDKTVGSLGYTMFVLFMMTGRLGGTYFLNKYGRTKTLRVTCVLAIVGLSIFIFAPNVYFGFFGLMLWGLGASLGFPTGMSAASDDPLKASVRVSVVSTIGYAAFLGGPPILGLLGEHFGIRNGLIAVLFFVVISLLLTGQLEKGQKKGVHQEPAYTASIPVITSSLPTITASQPRVDIRMDEEPKKD